MSLTMLKGLFQPLVTKRRASAKKTPAPLSTIVMPTVRRIFPELISEDLVNVQPMKGPVGKAFHMKVKYGYAPREVYDSWRKTHGDADRGFEDFLKNVYPTLEKLREL